MSTSQNVNKNLKEKKVTNKAGPSVPPRAQGISLSQQRLSRRRGQDPPLPLQARHSQQILSSTPGLFNAQLRALGSKIGFCSAWTSNVLTPLLFGHSPLLGTWYLGLCVFLMWVSLKLQGEVSLLLFRGPQGPGWGGACGSLQNSLLETCSEDALVNTP